MRVRGLLSYLIAIHLLLAGSGFSGQFTIEDGKFLLDGKPFQIICGEMHYLRVPHEYWRDRLAKARAMGLNTVSTYVFWNVHEPRQGEFNFAGDADVAEFVKTAQEEGLKVILRPGPYACAEWEFGGYPSWLLRDTGLVVRSRAPKFLDACRGYIDRLAKELVPLQYSRGGPIIMVQVENEYGSYGADTLYEGAIRDMIRHAGFDVPLFTADGPTQMPNAALADVLPAVNGATGEEIFTSIRRFRPDGPFFVPEFYPGWLDHWGEPHARVDAAETAKDIDWMLSHGVSFSFYMFHGGTNFGFMNGANYGGRFQPQPTSYDYDAPLDEAGNPTPKYFVYRETILRHLPESVVVPDVPPARRAIAVPSFRLDRTAGLLDALPSPVHSQKILTMEDVGQSYGYILYRTRLAPHSAGKLVIRDLRDYAVVLLNGRNIASLDRRNKQSSVDLPSAHDSLTLDILVENGGRINYGHEMLRNRKGITDRVLLEAGELGSWDIYPLPMDSSNMTRYDHEPSGAGGAASPAFFRGSFSLNTTGDTWLDMSEWTKGCVWVNGHNLGRYWYIGPQQTLYLPEVWLRKGMNEMVLFELEDHPGNSVRGVTRPVLDSLRPDRLKKPLSPRARGKVILGQADLRISGAFDGGSAPQDRTAAPVRGRYVCLQSLSSQAGDHFASIAEFYLLDTKGQKLPRDKWSLITVDSEELLAEDGHAENAFDDDLESIWHTEWGSAKPDHPHIIVIDLGQEATVGGLEYIARQNSAPGKIKDFRFYVREQPFEIDASR
jgi:beta-galactosidase